MRSEQEMFDLIINTAKNDDRIRAVTMNGSRANPNALCDIFQDFDVVYLVTNVASFKQDPTWIDRFGERMILQLPDDMPDDMQDLPPRNDEGFAYLIQFADGNRIDLSIYPLDKVKERTDDSMILLLLDKDGIVGPLPPASDKDYWPKPPSAKAFFDCCNEFWWCSPYVAKGLWRDEITNAKYMLEVVREELMKMMVWYIGMKTGFAVNPGKQGKYFKRYLEPDLWNLLLKTYSDADEDNTWEALYTMGALFGRVATQVADHFGYDYPKGDADRVSAHLRYVRQLPRDAKGMY
jgi:aminoglycoside 6-adenylyltransferase